VFDKDTLLYQYKDEYEIIASLIENNIRLASKKQKNYCSIPTNDLGQFLYIFEQKLLHDGFKITINSIFFTISW